MSDCDSAVHDREQVEATAVPSKFANQDQIQDDSKSDGSEQKLVNSNVDHELIEHQTLKASKTVVVEEYQEEDREN